MSTIQLIEEDKYCPNFVQLEAPSAFDLNKCAETVSLSKGKNGCHSTNGIFMHNGQDAGYCYCVTDDCTKSHASKSGLNTYKLSAVSSIDLYKEDMYCHNYTPLKSPSTFDLKSCAELVSLYKGKNGCQSTLDLLPPPFMHVGKGSGVCYCITDDCKQSLASTSGLNIYRYSESKNCSAFFYLCFGDDKQQSRFYDNLIFSISLFQEYAQLSTQTTHNNVRNFAYVDLL